MKRILAAIVVVFAALSLVSTAQASTASQRNALRSAHNYLQVSPFSKSGLVEQLKYDHYSSSDARWAVARVGVSWKKQAVKAARNYLKVASFSRQSLREQLEYDGFTPSQAAYGVSKAYH